MADGGIQTEGSVIAGSADYQPAANPQLEEFRYKPGENPIKESSNQTVPLSELPPVDETGVVADEHQYHPSPDSRFEDFRYKPKASGGNPDSTQQEVAK
jgi:hypothetical protein